MVDVCIYIYIPFNGAVEYGKLMSHNYGAEFIEYVAWKKQNVSSSSDRFPSKPAWENETSIVGLSFC